jgi:hypothetical protein
MPNYLPEVMVMRIILAYKNILIFLNLLGKRLCVLGELGVKKIGVSAPLR